MRYLGIQIICRMLPQQLCCISYSDCTILCHLGIQFHGGLVCVKFMVGLDNLKGLFQRQRFCGDLSHSYDGQRSSKDWGTAPSSSR